MEWGEPELHTELSEELEYNDTLRVNTRVAPAVALRVLRCARLDTQLVCYGVSDLMAYAADDAIDLDSRPTQNGTCLVLNPSLETMCEWWCWRECGEFVLQQLEQIIVDAQETSSPLYTKLKVLLLNISNYDALATNGYAFRWAKLMHAFAEQSAGSLQMFGVVDGAHVKVDTKLRSIGSDLYLHKDWSFMKLCSRLPQLASLCVPNLFVAAKFYLQTKPKLHPQPSNSFWCQLFDACVQQQSLPHLTSLYCLATSATLLAYSVPGFHKNSLTVDEYRTHAESYKGFDKNVRLSQIKRVICVPAEGEISEGTCVDDIKNEISSRFLQNTLLPNAHVQCAGIELDTTRLLKLVSTQHDDYYRAISIQQYAIEFQCAWATKRLRESRQKLRSKTAHEAGEFSADAHVPVHVRLMLSGSCAKVNNPPTTKSLSVADATTFMLSTLVPVIVETCDTLTVHAARGTAAEHLNLILGYWLDGEGSELGMVNNKPRLKLFVSSECVHLLDSLIETWVRKVENPAAEADMSRTDLLQYMKPSTEQLRVPGCNRLARRVGRVIINYLHDL